MAPQDHAESPLKSEGAAASTAPGHAAPPERRRAGWLEGRRLTLVIWALLLTMPYWMPWVGGYTSLGTRVLVLALAAMSVNFLLGFTGVLSFGHAAWFGLGAYGAGMTIRYLYPSTPLGMLVGVLG
jgi:ABC-type branched-subunit amino acid transport system permease subunit